MTLHIGPISSASLIHLLSLKLEHSSVLLASSVSRLDPLLGQEITLHGAK